jgi:hypothetical protein
LTYPGKERTLEPWGYSRKALPKGSCQVALSSVNVATPDCATVPLTEAAAAPMPTPRPAGAVLSTKEMF